MPAKGVAEMVRVVRPGGLVAAYAWDMPGGGFPFEPAYRELRALGHAPPLPPQADASRTDALQALWEGAGLEAVETREIAVRRRFEGFDAFWESMRAARTVRTVIEAMSAAEVARLEAAVRASAPTDGEGGIIHVARANTIKGRVPA